jgi:hypothetical protein
VDLINVEPNLFNTIPKKYISKRFKRKKRKVTPQYLYFYTEPFLDLSSNSIHTTNSKSHRRKSRNRKTDQQDLRSSLKKDDLKNANRNSKNRLKNMPKNDAKNGVKIIVINCSKMMLKYDQI